MANVPRLVSVVGGVAVGVASGTYIFDEPLRRWSRDNAAARSSTRTVKWEDLGRGIHSSDADQKAQTSLDRLASNLAPPKVPENDSNTGEVMVQKTPDNTPLTSLLRRQQRSA